MPPAMDWGATTFCADWTAGRLHQLSAEEGVSAQPAKRARAGWQEKHRSFGSIYRQGEARVEACQGSVGMQACNALADELYQALAQAPIDDNRLSVAGEKQRILTRALAMREVMGLQDSSVNTILQAFTNSTNTQAVEAAAAADEDACHGSGRIIKMQRSSNEAEPDSDPSQCILAVCLLMASLYEQTPYRSGELRRRVYSDFTQLKRQFRSDELSMMDGRNGTIKELFSSLKDMSERGKLENLMGIFFEDWKVPRRADPLLLAEQLEVQVLTLTSDGPIGKFMCKLRTLATVCVLHQRLLRELFAAAFVGRSPPKAQHEAMTDKDPLDFVDFTEAMARNVPHKLVDNTDLFLGWIYSPEVHAPPHVWEEIFGPGANRLPTLFDHVATPDTAVCTHGPDGDYMLKVDAAVQHDYLGQGSSMAAVGFPWADDLIGAYLRKVQASRAQAPATPSQSEQPAPLLPIQQQQSSSSSHSSSSGAVAAGDEQQPAAAAQAANAAQQVKQEPHGGEGQQQQPQQSHLQGSGAPGAEVKQEAVSSNSQQQAQEPSSQQQVHHFSVEVVKNGGSAGPKEQLRLQLQTSGVASWSMPSRPGFDPSAVAANKQLKPGQKAAAPAKPVEPIPNAADSGLIALPLGIFLVGIICSGPFTNTQIHVEDLLLMSININMFGAPKVWWWLPRDAVAAFKESAEMMTEGGRGELYTKSISPFLQDREYGIPEQVLPLDRLKELGAKRTIQMPGMGIWTMPGYAFHFTVSMGWNIAESANMFLEVMGWTLDKLWRARPAEQYPELEDDMGRYMRETGILQYLGVDPSIQPRPAEDVQRELAARVKPGIVPIQLPPRDGGSTVLSTGQQGGGDASSSSPGAAAAAPATALAIKRVVSHDVVKYAHVPAPQLQSLSPGASLKLENGWGDAMEEDDGEDNGAQQQQQQQQQQLDGTMALVQQLAAAAAAAASSQQPDHVGERCTGQMWVPLVPPPDTAGGVVVKQPACVLANL